MKVPPLWRRLVHGSVQLRERSDWRNFAGADWAECIMDVAVTDRFHAKQGRSTGRWVLHTGGARLAVYLKRHYHLPRWRGLLAALWPWAAWSPAFQEWDHLQWAQSQGIPVPAAVAAGEYRGPWGKLQSVLAVEELTGMLPLHEAIPLASRQLAPADFARWKRGLIAEMARLVAMLHGRRAFHKDLYLCHFYVLADDIPHLGNWPGRVTMIDLHRLARHSWTWRIWQLKDLAQLLYSSEVEGVTARDRLRFWHAYMDGARRSLAARWLRWAVVLKGNRYRQHNDRRRLAQGG